MFLPFRFLRISLKLTPLVASSSPFDLQLGDVAFNLTYQGVFLGEGTGSNVSISAQGNTSVSLAGTLVPHTDDPDALAVLGNVFSAYISDETTMVSAKGVYTRQPNGDEIGWLTQGVQSLMLTVPLKAPQPIDPIKTIDIGYLNLSFTEATEWGPMTNSNNVTAELGEFVLFVFFVQPLNCVRTNLGLELQVFLLAFL